MAFSEEEQRFRSMAQDRFTLLLDSDRFAGNVQTAVKYLQDGHHVTWVEPANPHRQTTILPADSAEELSRIAIRELSSHPSHPSMPALFVGHPRNTDGTLDEPPLPEDVQLLPWVARKNGNAILGCIAVTEDTSLCQLVAIHTQVRARDAPKARAEHVAGRLSVFAGYGLLNRPGQVMRRMLASKGFAIAGFSIGDSGRMPPQATSVPVHNLFHPGTPIASPENS